MPQVPYKAVPEVSQGFGTGAGPINLNVPGGAFGTNIAAALEKFGATMEQSGTELFQRASAIQALHNETKARNADAAYMEAVGKEAARFDSLEGANAGPEALQEHIQRLNELRQQFRNGLDNPQAQQMYDQSSMYTMGRNVFHAAGHSGEETKKSYVGSVQAQKVNTTSTLEHDPSNTNFEAVRSANEALNERLGQELGWTSEQVQKANRDDYDRAVERRVTRLARDHPDQARQILEDTRSKLDGDVALKLEDVVQSGEATAGVRDLVKGVMKDVTADTPPGKLGELEEEARAKAEKQWPSNLRAQENAKILVRAQYNNIKAVQADDLHLKQQTIADAIMAKGDPDRAIKSIDDLLKDPYLSETWNSLPGKDQQSFLNMIASNAKRDMNRDTPERTANFQRLSGMPGAGHAQDFADVDLNKEDLTFKQRMQLNKTQQQVRKGMAVESHSSHIMQDADVKTTLYDAGIIDDNDKPTDKQQFNRLHGMVNSDIQNFFDKYGKWPDEETERKIVYKAIQKQGTYPAWLGLTTKERPLFQQGLPNIPDKVKGDLTRKLKNEGIEAPTEEQIFQEFYRLQGGGR